MNFRLTSPPKAPDAKFECYRIRLLARLCVVLVCFVQFLSRIITINKVVSDTSSRKYLAIILLFFAPIMVLIVAIEYVMYKKKGPRALRHSQAVDIIILILLIADWIGGIFISLAWVKQTDPVLFPISTVYAFTTFGWRTLIVILVVQKWQLKIIAPIIALSVAMAMTIYYDPKNWLLTVIRGAAQMFNVVFIIYCEDKIKWMMIWNNIQQEKWMQVNNFILNNIPENIMILDMKGETKFISDYCKSFIDRFSANAKDLFSKIKDLQQQEEILTEPDENQNLQTQVRLMSEEPMLTETVNQQNKTHWLHVEGLTELITNFKIIMAEKNLKEKQFLIYNGKLIMENQSQDKAIEIKVSFIRHFENEYIILILRDTTQRDLLVTLQETNKYKDQLLASVSHELRAPLNGNINLVEAAISSPKIPENIKETLLTPALRSSKFLLHLINDILDMSQIKEKKLRLAFQSGDLFETLRSTAQLVELQARKKGIELILQLDPNLPEQFCTDHVRVSQIVLNLLNNAMKFTKEGTIKLIAEPMLEDPKWVKISVIDSGIGMSQENVKKLFSCYTHIEFEGRQAINPTGVGLGLNIAYNLVKLLAPKDHPTLDVESIPEQGSTFSFILENRKEENESHNTPCKVADELLIEIKPKLSSHLVSPHDSSQIDLLLDPCSCPRVLIVDDNPFNTMAFETILKSLEVKCDAVYSGSCAIEKLIQRETKKCGKDCKGYSVIFMDQEMPEMDGAETVRKIRRLQEEKVLTQNMKIIGCTAHHSKEEVEKFLEAGLDKCIHKPISPALISDIL